MKRISISILKFVSNLAAPNNISKLIISREFFFIIYIHVVDGIHVFPEEIKTIERMSLNRFNDSDVYAEIHVG